MSELIKKRRKTLIGVVTAKSGDKTVKVTYSYKIPHPRYQKEIKRKTVMHVHDEQNICQIGDKVEIINTRPLSRMKCWSVVSVLEKALITMV